MKKNPIIVLMLIVCLPMALLTWFGWRLAHDEQTIVQRNVHDLLSNQLVDIDHTISRHLLELESQLLDLTDDESVDSARIRELIRNEPLVSQLFILDATGRPLHPNLDLEMNQAEVDFLQRAETFLADRELIHLSGLSKETHEKETSKAETRKPKPQKTKTSKASLNKVESFPDHGWFVWFWGRGVNLIFWRRTANDSLICVELPRSRWISDLILQLPQTTIDPKKGGHTRVQLVDSNSRVIDQWGHFEPPASAEPVVELALSEPLRSWKFRYFVDDQHFSSLTGKTTYLNLFLGMGVGAVGLFGLAFYLYREWNREMREAATRVNFVNQVSHELKTPLTNIRMYAELLEQDLIALEPGDSTQPKKRLDVITSECKRLSRLIGNVLTFSRQQREQLKLHCNPHQVDHLVRSVIEIFEPTLKRKGIKVTLDAQANSTVLVDADVVEQILVNLVSNVEKYAADGKTLSIETRRVKNRSILRVIDSGPGLPKSERAKIFEPFYRIDDHLEGAAGAGIGLAIARALAQLHGGDVRLLETEQGALFEVELITELAPDSDSIEAALTPGSSKEERS